MLGFYLVVEIHSKFERTIKLNNLQITALIESSSAQRKHIFQNHQAPGFREPTWQKLFCFLSVSKHVSLLSSSQDFLGKTQSSE